MSSASKCNKIGGKNYTEERMKQGRNKEETKNYREDNFGFQIKAKYVIHYQAWERFSISQLRNVNISNKIISTEEE